MDVANAAPASVDALVDSAFSGADTGAADTSVDTSTADVSTETPVDDNQEPAEIEQVEATEETPTAEETVEDPYAEDEDAFPEPDRVSKDGKLHYYKPQKIAKYKQAYEDMRSLREAVPDATVESVQSMHRTAIAAEELMTDFSLADNASLDKVIGFFHEQSPEGLGKMATRLMTHLPQANPQAFNTISSYFAQNLINDLYQAAKSNGDEGALALAQNLDQKLRGTFVKKDELLKRADPNAAREAQLSQREREFAQRTNQERQQQVQQWTQGTHDTVETSLQGEITKALDPVKGNFNERQLRNISRDLREAIDKAHQSDSVWSRQYDILMRQAQARPGDEGARRQVVNAVEQFAKRVIAKSRKAAIESETQTAMSNAGALKTKAQQAQTSVKREQTGGSAAAAMPTPNAKMAKAKSFDELWARAVG